MDGPLQLWQIHVKTLTIPCYNCGNANYNLVWNMPIFSLTSSMYTQIFKKGFPPLKYFFLWSSHNFEFRQKDKSCFFNHGEEKVAVEFFEIIFRIYSFFYYWWRRSDFTSITIYSDYWWGISQNIGSEDKIGWFSMNRWLFRGGRGKSSGGDLMIVHNTFILRFS